MFEEDRKVMEQMKPAQKAGYIWDYYKLPIIGIAAAAAVVIYLLVIFFGHGPDPVLSVEVINSQVGIGNGTEFCSGFISYAGIDEKKGPVHFTNTLFFDLTRESDYGSTYYMKLLAELDAGTADAVIAGRDNTERIGQAGYFIDLTDERTEDLYEKYQDKIITVTDAEGTDHPIAFDISGSSALAGAGIYYESGTCLAISPKAINMGNVQKLLDYLYT